MVFDFRLDLDIVVIGDLLNTRIVFTYKIMHDIMFAKKPFSKHVQIYTSTQIIIGRAFVEYLHIFHSEKATEAPYGKNYKFKDDSGRFGSIK